jgi:hypothetical protein
LPAWKRGDGPPSATRAHAKELPTRLIDGGVSNWNFGSYSIAGVKAARAMIHGASEKRIAAVENTEGVGE